MKQHRPIQKSFLLATGLLLIAVQLLSYWMMLAQANQNETTPQQKTVRVATYDADEIFVLDTVNHKNSGYAYEYLETIAKYAGWDLNYVIYPGFTACIDAVKKGEADLAYDVSYTEERAQYLAFPNEPMGVENYYLYFLDTNKNIISGNLDTLQHKKIGVSRGTKQISILKEWLAKNHVDAEIVEYANSAGRRAALWAGEVDLNLIANRYNKPHFVAFGSIGEDNFYLVVNKARPDILKELNNAHRTMMSINPYFLTDISKRHFAYASIRKSLTEPELKWLEDHPVIRVGCLIDDPPFTYTDPKTQEIKGVYVDTLHRIFDVLNIEDYHLEFKMYYSQDDMLIALRNNQIDLISQYYFDYNKAAMDNVIISSDIYDAQIGIVRKAGTSYSDAFERLAYEKKRNKGYAGIKYPEATFIPCKNLLDCLDEVNKGNATGVIGLSSTLAIYTQAYPELEYTPLMDTVPIAFATSKDNKSLITMLDKGRGLINNGEIDAMLAGHQPMAPFSVHKFISNNLAACILGLIALMSVIMVFLFMTVTNRRLKAKNQLIDDQNTALKEYQAKLTQSLEDVQKADKAKTSFLFNMSHDIRTPMNAIIGFTGLLEKNIDNKELALSYIDKIQSSNNFLLSLINNVLEMARIESGKATVDESYADINLMMPEIGAIFEPQMKEKGLDFKCSLNVEHNHVMLDTTKVREILLNLISNALKYTPSGGSVTFAVTEEPSAAPGMSTYKVVVADTGIGMPKDFLETIFDAFTREKNTTQSGVIGTGLGMHIVKKLVDLLGGTINIESELGKGTTITLLMPTKLASEHLRKITERENKEIDTSKFKGMRILLAEDNELNAEIAQTILEDQGFKVEHAHNGVEAVDMLNSSEPGYYDLILMDVQMPQMDGYKATITIRGMKDPVHSSIPIIAMTANAFDEDKRAALLAGMNAHIPKPFDVHKLFGTIEMVLKHKDYYIRSHAMDSFREKYEAMGLKCGYLIFRPNKMEETIYTDETVLDIFGCSSFEDFTNYAKGSVKNIVIVKEREDVSSKVHEMESASYIGNFKFSITRQDGETRNLDSIGCRAYTGEEIVCFVYVVDITNTNL
ncbi:Phytochrome, two-component sensor histidine kinase [Anaerovibrio sp. JC8]|uniref:ATP-binding protein n=1 Tax=Anaerovibrio sp. JC8 TaxID=1240085 RepID=UPI000A0DF647|nr:transporter substrate-binding domain-containing protein [Anaerovibrio sp. JC8]ORT99853.1 Phytochrome, two-component sensor histidine kinase [Anaerovibrio sp. JC8]